MIEQFLATIKVKIVNEKYSLPSPRVMGNKVLVTEVSVRRDLQLNNEEGTDCLPNSTFFEELTRMGYEKLSQKLTFYKAFFSPQWKFLSYHFAMPNMVKNLDNAGKFLMYPRTRKNVFLEWETPLFSTIMVQNQADMGEGSAIPTDPHHTPTIIQPSTSQPQRKQRPRKPKRKDTEIPQSSGPTDNVADEAVNEEIGWKFWKWCHLNTAYKLRCRAGQWKIDDIDKDAKITLVDETHGRYGVDIMFDVSDLAGEEVFVARTKVPDSKKEDAAQLLLLHNS
ncbi:hypothetical protein Tco_0970975 [Tanacetum coccineum]